ncbi:hypothetical protein [Actinomadura madurae]|uniref:hypothetical protein n=1 Tax=Actinomadura madurae TaxID=1993 RepID=UPI0020D22153|nr:hypothetical protein [Actinomadura madurae]MCP9953179.1 hypothetical protein [Actinomadura madurae]MCQ0006080.1 hypothetical protein [Actinomadura madurae]
MRPMRALVRTLAVAGACGAVVAASLAVPGTARAAAGGPGWRLTPTGGDARFRGLAAVSGKVAWLAGSGGAVLRTTDAGPHVAGRRPAWRGRAGVPRHRGVRRAAGRRPRHRRRRRVARLRDLGRRPELDARFPE